MWVFSHTSTEAEYNEVKWIMFPEIESLVHLKMGIMEQARNLNMGPHILQFPAAPTARLLL
jgi:hypothetical protein